LSINSSDCAVEASSSITNTRMRVPFVAVWTQAWFAIGGDRNFWQSNS
jgi:hypothetical protein